VRSARGSGLGSEVGSTNILARPVVLPDTEKNDMQSFARRHRAQLLVEDKQALMIWCAWVIPAEKCQFKMFGDVLHISAVRPTRMWRTARSSLSQAVNLMVRSCSDKLYSYMVNRQGLG
jgi:hypothetical protein